FPFGCKPNPSMVPAGTAHRPKAFAATAVARVGGAVETIDFRSFAGFTVPPTTSRVIGLALAVGESDAPEIPHASAPTPNRPASAVISYCDRGDDRSRRHVSAGGAEGRRVGSFSGQQQLVKTAVTLRDGLCRLPSLP